MIRTTIEQLTRTRIPTDAGEFQLCLYHNSQDEKEHLALVMGDVNGQDDVLVRVHSECFTGDVLGSRRCDCGHQLNRAMQLIAAEGRGIILYLRQEGRGIGLLDKLRAYNLQDAGYDTVEANLLLGHQADERDYTFAALILQDLGLRSLRLLTNNPTKIEGLARQGIVINARVPLPPQVTADNAGYLTTKVKRMRHLLDLGAAKNGSRLPREAASLANGAGKWKRPFITLELRPEPGRLHHRPPRPATGHQRDAIDAHDARTARPARRPPDRRRHCPGRRSPPDGAAGQRP